jgi:hypothetical protein
LQTRGKHYLARAANIAEYTGGRFDPRGELVEQAAPLPPDAPFVREPLRAPARPLPGVRSGLLLTLDDLHPESAFDRSARSSSPSSAPVQWTACAVLDADDPGSPLPLGEVAAGFRAAALDDAARRQSALIEGEVARIGAASVVDWARAHSLRQVVAPHGRVGSTSSLLAALGPALDAHGIALVQWQRQWDAAAWPHAARGFFAFRDHIGALTADGAAMNRSA